MQVSYVSIAALRFGYIGLQKTLKVMRQRKIATHNKSSSYFHFFSSQEKS